MGGIQSSYPLTLAAAVAGLVADSGYDYSISGNPDSGVTPAAGLFVVRSSSGERLFKLPTAATDITNVGLTMGVLAYEPARTPTTYGLSALQPNVPWRIVRRGMIWVTVEETVVDGDDVYVRYATGSASQKGAFRTSSDSTTAALLAGAIFKGGASAGGLCKVELNLP